MKIKLPNKRYFIYGIYFSLISFGVFVLLILSYLLLNSSSSIEGIFFALAIYGLPFLGLLWLFPLFLIVLLILILERRKKIINVIGIVISNVVISLAVWMTLLISAFILLTIFANLVSSFNFIN